MSKKKPTRKPKQKQPAATTKAASPVKKKDQADASVAAEEASPVAAATGPEPVAQATTPEVTPAALAGKGKQDNKSATIEKDQQTKQATASEPVKRVKKAAVTPQGKGGNLIAWLALCMAFLALVAFGIDFIGDRRAADDNRADDDAVAAESASVRALQDSLAASQQDVTAMANDLAARAGEIAAVERRFGERLRRFETIPDRVSTIEDTVTSLQGISTGARDAWLLAEAEYYMQIGNAQLQLAGNPHLASLALSLADERILQLANPALIDVRRALANELRALDVMEKTDTEGVTLTLASLAGVAGSLPLKQELGLPEAGPNALDPELTGTDRALASLKNAISSAVSVRRVGEDVRPFIAPEAQYFLQLNLALQLQAARLAILRGEEAIFERSLDDATAWLTEYYDTNSAAVQTVLQTIADIRGSALSVAIPDISGSLQLLRQFKALADAKTAPIAALPDELAAEPEQ